MNIIKGLIRRLGPLAWLAVLLGVLAPRGAFAEDREAPEVSAQRLVHILGYVAADYGGAVENGAIKNQTEYDEQIALLADAAKLADKLAKSASGAPGGRDARDEVSKVRALVEAKASADRVASVAREARVAITSAYRVPEAPSAPPNLERAKALYAEHCATCHGAIGRADTPRAGTLSPRPANFHDPAVAGELSPARALGAVRFGINGTAMIPYDFLSDDDRWALAFYVVGLRHEGKPADDAPTYSLAELASRSDDDLKNELSAAGFSNDHAASALADLRRLAPYEDRAGKSPLALARTKLARAKVALYRGDRAAARGELIDAYLEGIEPAEGPLRAVDAALVTSLEEKFLAARGRLDAGDKPAQIEAQIASLLADLSRAELLLKAQQRTPSFMGTAVASGGILLREGVEAALLIAALLGMAAQAGLAERRRWVHAGWASALLLGLLTWLVSARLVAISGARRELIEGVTAIAAALVLFYVSYALLAGKEVARWMKFLRGQVSPRRAAISLFGVAFLAAYREVFETVLFYQALLASKAQRTATILGALGGAALLAVLVMAYSRAGKFAPPRVFFKVSSTLLYALAVVFAGQGVAALQLTGALPIHPLGVPSIPALGVHPTVETTAAQVILLALYVVGVLMSKEGPVKSAPALVKEPEREEAPIKAIGAREAPPGAGA